MRQVCDAMMLLLLMVAVHRISAQGYGGRGDWSFCKGSCTLGQGDCDTDTDCHGNLVCGDDNCRQFNSHAHRYADCCKEPEWDGQCVSDGSRIRLLEDKNDMTANTPTACIKLCARKGYKYAGVQYGRQCFCGNEAPPSNRIRPMTECSYTCNGDASQKCGGRRRMNVYKAVWNGQCVSDGVRNHLLDDENDMTANTPTACIKLCTSKGYKYAGVKMESQCFCGNEEPPSDRIRPLTECGSPCNGDTSQKCGGRGRMNVYTAESCYCGLAQRTRRNGFRIVDGKETEVNEYPWQVGIVNKDENYIGCGGSVISDQWVLTAAHCTEDKKLGDFKVLLGEHNYAIASETATIRMDIAQIIEHPDYKKIADFNYDVSLLRLTRKIDFSSNSHIRPICLPVAGSTKNYDDYIATVTGWGRMKDIDYPDALQEVNVKVISNTDCSTKYSPLQSPLFPREYQITESMICAEAEDGNGGQDACDGDSGGPLVTKEPGSNGEATAENYELIGVVSYGVVCGRKDFPGVYARVTEIMDWITKTTGSLNTCPRS